MLSKLFFYVVSALVFFSQTASAQTINRVKGTGYKCDNVTVANGVDDQFNPVLINDAIVELQCDRAKTYYPDYISNLGLVKVDTDENLQSRFPEDANQDVTKALTNYRKNGLSEVYLFVTDHTTLIVLINSKDLSKSAIISDDTIGGAIVSSARCVVK
jgi:hypothetical protein